MMLLEKKKPEAANNADLTIQTLKQSVAEVRSHTAVDNFDISGIIIYNRLYKSLNFSLE